jgi:hypothetical protein
LQVTINPSDSYHPLALTFAGVGRMDLLTGEGVPTAKERLHRISKDPVASALFFNAMISAIITHLFGFKKIKGLPVSERPGIFGRLRNYFGTVECTQRVFLSSFALLLPSSPYVALDFRCLGMPALARTDLGSQCSRPSRSPGGSGERGASREHHQVR